VEKINELLNIQVLKIGAYSLSVANLVSAAAVLLIGWLLILIIHKSFKRRVKLRLMDKGNAFAITQIARYVIWTIALLLALQNLGVNISFILAGSAALLVGVGLGLQQTFKDFFAGIIILIDGSVKVGDLIETDGTICHVQKIGLRTAIVVTHDDVEIIIPNSKLTSESLINWTHADKIARFHVDVGVAYDIDVEKVTELLHNCVDNKEKKVGKTSVILKSFQDSAMLFHLYFWTDDIIHVEEVKSAIRCRILEKFKQHNIQIPFPQHTVWLKQK
jgi:small-conductance mechanosensitive channel